MSDTSPDFEETAQELKIKSDPEPTPDDKETTGTGLMPSVSKAHVGLLVVLIIVGLLLVQRRRSTNETAETNTDDAERDDVDETQESDEPTPAQEEFDKVRDMTGEVVVESNQTPTETIPQNASAQEEDEAVARVLRNSGTISGGQDD